MKSRSRDGLAAKGLLLLSFFTLYVVWPVPSHPAIPLRAYVKRTEDESVRYLEEESLVLLHFYL